ncbi:TPA: glycosyl transferase [archaeon]|nr:glycosyl transferase [Candidatus Naiadarchaeales archaeon SRR2090153.bin461]
METINLILIGAAFLLSMGFTVFSIKRLGNLGIVARDLHKENSPKRPKIGGIGISAAFSIVLVLFYALDGSFTTLVILLAFLVQAAIGLMDDLLAFKPWRKLILASFGAIPLLFLTDLNPFAIIFVFAAVTIASNWTNMVAGFNGLEAGMGAIMLTFLALNTGAQHTQAILLIYAAVLAGFLIFNKYPAKIFPGDSGTLPIGAVLVGATLIGAPFYKLAILLIPYAIDAALKFTSFGIMSSSMTKPTEVKNGYLVMPKEGAKSYLSLSRLILSFRSMREWELVFTVWTIEIIIGMLTLII